MNLFPALAALAALIASEASAQSPGLQALSIDAPHHGRAMTGALFYPTDADGPSQDFGKNRVFEGVEVMPNADPSASAHPLVLLSHGMGGTVRSLTWLAHGLADRGAVVVVINHPNSTWGDFDLAKATAHWTRAEDMQVALDHVLEDPTFGALIDTDRIMAAGFSFGGWTALSLGGVRGNHAGYADHCEVYGEASNHCADMIAAGVSLDEISAEAWNASYRDTRVTHIAAIDPGFVWGLEAVDVADSIANVRLVGLGDGEDRLLATDFDQSGLINLLPGATVQRFAPAVHFSALPQCSAIGAAILLDEGEPPVCTDPPGADRATIHVEIVDALAQDLGL